VTTQDDVFKLRLGKHQPLNLTRSTDRFESPLAWLRNGRIAFQSSQPGGLRIATMNETGNDAQTLTLPGVDYLGGQSVAWSPSGRKIAYVASDRIYVANADGSGQHAITGSAHNAYELSWSPKGDRIAFASFGPIKTRGIYVMGSDGSGIRRVAIGNDPSWSPDGTKLVYAHDVPSVSLGSVQRLFVKDLRNLKPGVPLY
jgi:TolB protein